MPSPLRMRFKPGIAPTRAALLALLADALQDSGLPSEPSVRLGQLRRALKQSGYPANPEDLGIPSDENSDVAIAWGDAFVPFTGTLATHLQSGASVDLSSSQWATVFALASTL